MLITRRGVFKISVKKQTSVGTSLGSKKGSSLKHD